MRSELFLKLICCFIFCLGLSQNIRSQTIQEKDSLIEIMCSDLKKSQSLNDTIRINKVFSKHLYPFIFRYQEDKDKDKGEAIFESIFIRFQHKCEEFVNVLDRINPLESDEWKVAKKKPISIDDKKTCQSVFNNNKLSYQEPSDGTTVYLKMTDGVYEETFEDGSYSRLKFEWINDCEFQLTFIESNHKIRKNFSKAGDVFKYQVVSIEKNFYWFSAEISGQSKYYLFKVHYEK